MKRIITTAIICGLANLAFSQNFGIDNASPQEKLHVNGNLRVSTGVINSDGDHLEIMSGVRSDDNAYEWIGFYSGGTRQGIMLYDGAWSGANNLTNEFSLTAEGSNLLTLNTQANHIALMPKGGNVGIGTLSPVRKLEVNNAMKFTNSSSDANDGVIGTAPFSAGLNIVGINTDGGGRKVSWWGSFLQQENAVGNTFVGNSNFTGQIQIQGGSPAAGRVLTSDASGLASWAPAGSTSGVKNVSGAVSTYVIGTRYYVKGTYGTDGGRTIPLDMTIVQDLCGDEDGCRMRFNMRYWTGFESEAASDGNGNPSSYLFTYDNSNGRWRMSGTSGIDGNGVTQHVISIYSGACYFTDGTYSGYADNGDAAKSLGLLIWNGAYTNAARTCELTLED